MRRVTSEMLQKIKDNPGKVNWKRLIKMYIIPEEILRDRKYRDYIDWCSVSMNQSLTEKFIRDFEIILDWKWLSCFQKLSESLIRDFKDKYP